MALTIDPVYGLLKALHKGDTCVLLDVLFHGAIGIDVVLDLVGERFELVLDSLEVKDVEVLGEPLVLEVEEVLSHLRSKRVGLRVDLE